MVSEEKLLSDGMLVEAREASDEDLLVVHTRRYLNELKVQGAWGEGWPEQRGSSAWGSTASRGPIAAPHAGGKHESLWSPREGKSVIKKQIPGWAKLLSELPVPGGMGSGFPIWWALNLHRCFGPLP